MTAKRKIAIVMTLLLVAIFLCACANLTDRETYRVTVLNEHGEPAADVMVEFLKNTKKIAAATTDSEGIAQVTLAKGVYTVVPRLAEDATWRYFSDASQELTKQKTSTTIVLYALPFQTETLQVGETVHEAGQVHAGTFCVSLEADKRNYFLFAPELAGTYRFSVEGAQVRLGYYGAPHFIQDTTLVEVTECSFILSFNEGMVTQGEGGTVTAVIGIDAGANTQCTLSIQRIAEPERTLADEPWEIYQPTVKIADFCVEESAELHDFDLMAAGDEIVPVFNEEDGFYHLNEKDGPVILCRLGSKSAYLDSFEHILKSASVVKYEFGDDGAFLRKISYNDCLFAYLEHMDPTHKVYPLTEDLKHIICESGDYAGWFDETSEQYIFRNEDGTPIDGIDPSLAWLFMCCYDTHI